MALLASLQDSPFFDSFADRANAWSQRLGDLDQGLVGFQAVQRRWVYLEPILGKGALPKETARFAQVDVEFRRILSTIKVDNRVVNLVTGSRGAALKEQLSSMQVSILLPMTERANYSTFLNGINQLRLELNFPLF